MNIHNIQYVNLRPHMTDVPAPSTNHLIQIGCFKLACMFYMVLLNEITTITLTFSCIKIPFNLVFKLGLIFVSFEHQCFVSFESSSSKFVQMKIVSVTILLLLFKSRLYYILLSVSSKASLHSTLIRIFTLPET